MLKAHNEIIGEPPKPPKPPVNSMWRDINVFNQMGIPSLSYGPPVWTPSVHGFSLDQLVQSAQIYARVALDLCNQDKPDED